MATVQIGEDRSTPLVQISQRLERLGFGLDSLPKAGFPPFSMQTENRAENN
jgi:hypothetical protein